MFFAATGNIAVVGYKANLVAFESKVRRNEFLKNNGDYHAAKVTEAKNYEQYEDCREYPQTIFDLDRKLVGVAMFYMNGEFAYIS